MATAPVTVVLSDRQSSGGGGGRGKNNEEGGGSGMIILLVVVGMCCLSSSGLFAAYWFDFMGLCKWVKENLNIDLKEMLSQGSCGNVATSNDCTITNTCENGGGGGGGGGGGDAKTPLVPIEKTSVKGEWECKDPQNRENVNKYLTVGNASSESRYCNPVCPEGKDIKACMDTDGNFTIEALKDDKGYLPGETGKGESCGVCPTTSDKVVMLAEAVPASGRLAGRRGAAGTTKNTQTQASNQRRLTASNTSTTVKRPAQSSQRQKAPVHTGPSKPLPIQKKNTK